MKTIVIEKSTKIVSYNVLIKIEEDGNTIYMPCATHEEYD